MAVRSAYVENVENTFDTCRLIPESCAVRLTLCRQRELLCGTLRHGPASTTIGKNLEVCPNSRGSLRLAPRILQESFQKRQQEDYPDCAHTRKCNLNHAGVFSTERAKQQFIVASWS
jgi:hypothetical protein